MARPDSHEYTTSSIPELPVTSRWLALFEDRHGPGAYEQLRALFAKPCVTFAHIAQRFGVTRECVRQWHLLVMPEAPQGHARQQLCGALRRRRRLFEDPLFKAFFVDVRRDRRQSRLELLKGTTGYRSRTARLDGRLVALRESVPQGAGADAARCRLSVYRGPAEFVYIRLTDGYLFVPSALLASGRSLSAWQKQPGLCAYRNSFAALIPQDGTL